MPTKLINGVASPLSVTSKIKSPPARVAWPNRLSRANVHERNRGPGTIASVHNPALMNRRIERPVKSANESLRILSGVSNATCEGGSIWRYRRSPPVTSVTLKKRVSRTVRYRQLNTANAKAPALIRINGPESPATPAIDPRTQRYTAVMRQTPVYASTYDCRSARVSMMDRTVLISATPVMV